VNGIAPGPIENTPGTTKLAPGMTPDAVEDAIAERVTLASGASAKAARRLCVGDAVTIGRRGEPTVAGAPVPILASGDGWVVVDKPAGIGSTPSSRRPGDDVASRMRLAPAHRLDRFTSGCLVLTGDRATARAMDLAFREHRVQKSYLAVVHGEPPQERFAIDAPLGLATGSRVTGKVGVAADGAAAHTDITVLVRAGDRTLVQADPRTGRRHQIRAHLAHVGLPIVGDLLYGADERQFIRLQRGQRVAAIDGLLAGRHLLHAHRIMFPDPTTQQLVDIASPWPADFGFVAAQVDRRETLS
jgi:23S rRNA pseudouridine1911/1915/1917 synthase